MDQLLSELIHGSGNTGESLLPGLLLEEVLPSIIMSVYPLNFCIFLSERPDTNQLSHLAA